MSLFNRKPKSAGVDPHIAGADDTQRAIDTLLALDGPAMGPCDVSPIFVLALGWGSGSTLIQRILMTDPSLLVWGEPYGRMGLITSVTAALSAVTDKWPRDRFVKELAGDELTQNFVANHYPPAADLLEGYRALMLRTYSEPAQRRGFDRWGLKEVRLCAGDAALLARLFPNARFVVVKRDPYDCYRSSQDMTTRWRHDTVIDTAERFAKLWSEMAGTWVDPPKALAHVVVSYEDVAAGRYDFRSLEEFVGLKLDETKALGVRAGQRGNRRELAERDRQTIRKLAGPVMKAMGYTP